MERLKNKVALISGSGAGIGENICMRFAQEGAAVVGMDLNQGEAERVAQFIQKQGGKAYAQSGDISKKEDCARVVEWAKTNLGKIDVLCNVAGIVEGGTLLDISERSWQRSIDINLKGMLYMCQLVVPEMVRQGGGAVINISSVAGIVAVRDRAIYSITKAGVIGLTKSLAIDFIDKGIRANAICPTTIDTPSLRERVRQAPDPQKKMEYFNSLQPMGRIGKAEEVSALAAYLASDESGFMTGQALAIDGGMTM